MPSGKSDRKSWPACATKDPYRPSLRSISSYPKHERRCVGTMRNGDRFHCALAHSHGHAHTLGQLDHRNRYTIFLNFEDRNLFKGSLPSFSYPSTEARALPANDPIKKHGRLGPCSIILAVVFRQVPASPASRPCGIGSAIRRRGPLPEKIQMAEFV